MTEELKDKIENELINAGFVHAKKANTMHADLVPAIYNSIRKVQIYGSNRFENETCFQPPLKNIVYKLA